MKNLHKLVATILLGLVLGLPVCAGDMNSPPAPAPCTVTIPGEPPNLNFTGPVHAGDTDAKTVVIRLLARIIISLY